jgi:hypothetical protein
MSRRTLITVLALIAASVFPWLFRFVRTHTGPFASFEDTNEGIAAIKDFAKQNPNGGKVKSYLQNLGFSCTYRKSNSFEISEQNRMFQRFKTKTDFIYCRYIYDIFGYSWIVPFYRDENGILIYIYVGFNFPLSE